MARILAVEDEADLCELLKEELEAEGHEVVTAENGIAALHRLRAFVPDIVISDVSMPELDGFGLLEQVRSDFPALADTPFLFLTALKNREDEMRARDCGVDDYLTKPIDFDMLHSILATRLRQVARMRERKELQMVKLYKALTDGSGAAPQGDNSAEPAPTLRDEFNLPIEDEYAGDGDAAEPAAAPERRRVFGSVFRFPNLKHASRNAPGAGATLRQRAMSRAAEILDKLVYTECVVSTDSRESLAVAYPDADEEGARELSKNIGKDLQDRILKDQAGIWKAEFELDEETIAQALVVSEALFEISLPPEDCCPEKFRQAVNDVIDRARTDVRAPTLLVSSIRSDDGHLAPLRMIARNGDELPIRFFSYDERSRRKLRACFTFFGQTNREKASYLVDVLTLELMEGAVRHLERTEIAVVDVHFRTLVSKIYSPTFVRKFHQFAKHAPYSLMLNVRAVPPGFSAAEFEEILRPLGRYATRRSIQIEPDEIASLARSRLSVACVVCSYPELSVAPDAARTLREIKPSLASSGSLLVLRGLDSEDDIQSMKDFGFDGYAIDIEPATAGHAS